MIIWLNYKYLIYIVIRKKKRLILLTKKLPNSFLNKALCWAVIIMLTAGLSEAVTHIIKPFAGRARYRTLNVLNNFDLYTPWYVFNGKVSPDELMLTLGVASDGFKSFPSGHSSSVAMLIVLTALPKLIPSLNTKGKKTILYLAVFLGVFAVTFSRILVGAHYLSDVLVGTFITLLCYFVVDLVMNKIFEKYLKLQPLNEKVRIIRLQEENI